MGGQGDRVPVLPAHDEGESYGDLVALLPDHARRPVDPPSRHHLARLLCVVRDARPALALTTPAYRDRLGNWTDPGP